jgi:hypothetical protein
MGLSEMIEIGGALLILCAFGGAQLRRLDQHAPTYLLLNLVGSAILAVIALLQSSWGFLLLEGSWAIVSAVSLFTRGRGAGDQPPES